MIGSALGRIATAERMSVDQLKEALQNKTLPAYIAIPLIEEKMDMTSRMRNMAAMQQAQQQQPPIAEQVMQRAATEGGIDALPSNIAPAQGMAGGGIVAFEDGGYVEPIRFQNRGVVPKTQEELDREAILDKIRRGYAVATDVISLPARGIAGAFESGVTRPLRAFGVPMPYLPKEFYGPAGDPTSMTPYYDVIRKEDAAKAAAEPTAVKPDAKIPDTATAAPPAAPAAPDGTTQAAPGQGLRLPAVPSTTSSMDATKKLLEGDQGIGGYFARSEDREKRLMDALGKDRLQGKAFSEYESMLKKEGEQAGLDKDQAKYMALLKAGLSMMAGTSRHALENIGKGAMVGASDYQEAYKDLRKAERERTKEFALIEQARRAEERDDLKRRDELLMRASDAAQKRDDFGTQALITAGVEDSRAARDIWKTQYSGGVTLQAANIAAASRNRPGITAAQLAKFRESAMKNVDQNAIRAQVAKQLKLSKVPAPGADKKFDTDVAAAYEKAINDYVQQVLGGVASSASALPQGFRIVGSDE